MLEHIIPDLNQVISRIILKIQSYNMFKFFSRVVTEFGHDNCSNMAAGLSYYVFLSVFPLILALVGLFGLVLPEESVKNSIFGFIQANIPWAGDLVQTNIESVIRLRGALGIGGLIGLLISGSGLLGAIGSAINRAWDIKAEMPFLFKQMRNIALTIGLSILFFLALGLSTLPAFESIGDIPFVGSLFFNTLATLVGFMLIFAVFLILFKVMPNTRTYWRHIWPGAFITAVLFTIGHLLLNTFFTRFTNYQLIYGSIGSVIVLLVWIYYSGIILLYGVEFTAEYARLRRGIGRGIHSH